MVGKKVMSDLDAPFLSGNWYQPFLDDYTEGFATSGLSIIGARPGGGKTRMMVDLLYRQWQNGRNVVLVSHEQPEAVMLSLLGARMTDIDSTVILKQTWTKEQRNAIFDSLRTLFDSQRFLMICDLENEEDVPTVLKMHRPSMIGIDFLQCRITSPTRSRFELILMIKQFRRWAYEYNCHVLLASQLRRDASGDPRLEDFAESDAIAQYADNAVLLQRRFSHRYGFNAVRCIVAKARFGRLGDAWLPVRWEHCKIE